MKNDKKNANDRYLIDIRIRRSQRTTYFRNNKKKANFKPLLNESKSNRVRIDSALRASSRSWRA